MWQNKKKKKRREGGGGGGNGNEVICKNRSREVEWRR